MKSKSKIRIISRHSSEYTSKVTLDNNTYDVFTENKGEKTHQIATTVYLKGKIIYSKTYDYAHLTKQKDSKLKIAAFMEKQHKSTVQAFSLERSSKKKKAKSDYFEDIKELLKEGEDKAALKTVNNALEEFPDDPFFLSYYGCLIAVVDKKPKEGIQTCKKAIKLLAATVPMGGEVFYPDFYLNLGRAYLTANKKVEALRSYKRGLMSDPENYELLFELSQMGERRKPPIRFLERSNPINKYIGKLVYHVSRKR